MRGPNPTLNTISRFTASIMLNMGLTFAKKLMIGRQSVTRSRRSAFAKIEHADADLAFVDQLNIRALMVKKSPCYSKVPKVEVKLSSNCRVTPSVIGWRKRID